MKNWWRFQQRQWRLSKIKRNELKTKKLMDDFGLDYDDVNERQAVKTALKESNEWLKGNCIN